MNTWSQRLNLICSFKVEQSPTQSLPCPQTLVIPVVIVRRWCWCRMLEDT